MASCSRRVYLWSTELNQWDHVQTNNSPPVKHHEEPCWYEQVVPVRRWNMKQEVWFEDSSNTQQFMLLSQHRSPDQPMRKHVQCEHSQLISLPFSPALCDTPNIFGVSCFSEWTEPQPLTQTLDRTPQLTLLTLLTLLIFFKGYFNY